MQRELRPPPTVPTLSGIIEELEQQRQAQVLHDQLEPVRQMKDHLMTQQMQEPTNTSLRARNERLRSQSEQQIILLEQLEGYLFRALAGRWSQAAGVAHLPIPPRTTSTPIEPIMKRLAWIKASLSSLASRGEQDDQGIDLV